MRLTQGQFSYLPDLSEEEILAQVRYALDNGWAPAVEYTDDPNPRNYYWEMWGTPLFDVEDPSEVLDQLKECHQANPGYYVALNAYASKRERQGIMLNFIVYRPPEEPGFRLDRQALEDRRIGYTLHPYAGDRPHGQRYGDGQP